MAVEDVEVATEPAEGVVPDGGRGAAVESHTYQLTPRSVTTLPGGHRMGVVKADHHEVGLAFLGIDPRWTGGRSLRRGETIVRAGLALTYLGGEFCERAGAWVAELRCVAPAPSGLVARLTHH